MRVVFLICFATALSAPAVGKEEQICLIVHQKNPISEMKKKDLMEILKGEKTIWKTWNKTPIVIAMVRDSEAFLKKIDLTSVHFRKIWLKLALSGRHDPPKTFGTACEVLQFVERTPGAIGWFVGEDNRKEARNKKMKIIPVTEMDELQ